jgi:hypothetical protein
MTFQSKYSFILYFSLYFLGKKFVTIPKNALLKTHGYLDNECTKAAEMQYKSKNSSVDVVTRLSLV